MRKYDICITEELERVIEVEAESQEEAERKARDAYDRERIVLDADDFIGTKFETLCSVDMDFSLPVENKALFVKRINDALIECGAKRYDFLEITPMVYDQSSETVSIAGGKTISVACDSLPAMLGDIYKGKLLS